MRNITQIIDSLKPQKKVFIIGSAFLDMLISVKQLPKSGFDVTGVYEGLKLGGCSFNVADVLAKLKLPFDSYLPIGEGNFANIAKEEFNKRQLPICEIKGRGDNGWCLSLIEQDGQRSFISMSGIETKMQFTDFQNYNLTDYDYVYISGYQLEGQNAQVMMQVIQNLRDDCSIIFDPGPKIDLIDEAVYKLLNSKKLIYNINASEAMSKTKCSTIEDAIKALYEQTHNIVCVTAGADGAYIATQSGTIEHITGFKVAVADTVGSGDSHSGGLLAGLMCNLDVKESVLLANKIASIVTSKIGAACAPSIDELKVYN